MSCCSTSRQPGATRSRPRKSTRLICRVAEKGIAVVLVEHDMKLVMKISHRILVLDAGSSLRKGRQAEVRENPAVHQAILANRGAKEVQGA